ncbi:MAG: gliding motility-associated C-terminal domain-containing protein [Saprospiraceae bacterium]|nr:gliding motility-associated C-terminal domain-containing protein [Saprospiraceae bacterium]
MSQMIRTASIITALLMTYFMVEAQRPFVCRGEYYLTLRPEAGNFNELFTVDINPDTERVTFSEVPGFDNGFDLNAMGYRVTDNYIYIVEQTVDNALLRIGGDGSITRLRAMTELPDLRYFAAACTPDGNYLVISASPFDFGFGSANINLVFVDLRDPNYPTRIVELDNNRYLFFDMAFDPFTGDCYGYDSNERTLIKIDINNGSIRPVGRGGQISTSMGALFFDAFGRLYGYGRPEGSTSQNTLFEIDKNTGRVTARTTGEAADRSDGCSCPYTIKLTKDVFPRETLPCGEVNYKFVIGNASAIVRDGITFRDIMPEGFEIVEIVRNPFGGDLIETGRPNELILENISVPLGIDSIIVKVRIGPELAGIYKNQAILDNLPESLGGYTKSDDPRTLRVADSTALFVRALEVDLDRQNYLVCPGETLTLRGDRQDASYLWQDQFTGQAFEVTRPGTYWVEARTLCEVKYDTIVVEYAPPLSVEVGGNYDIILGDSIEVSPIIEGQGPFTYTWSTTDDAETIHCPSCAESSFTPFNNAIYTLSVADAAGCIASDDFEVMVDRNVYIWIPNAFSPNGDGHNDFFYVQGRYPYQIASFEIYNRWGNRLFATEDILVNDETAGWDGLAGSESMIPAVYVYKVVLTFVDGSTRHFTGDVTLVR